MTTAAKVVIVIVVIILLLFLTGGFSFSIGSTPPLAAAFSPASILTKVKSAVGF